MDRYLDKEKDRVLEGYQIHEVGVISMMIASKMEEMYPLKFRTVFDKIAHQKISESDILNKEQRISQVLGFTLNSWTFYDLAMAKVYLLLQLLNKPRAGILSKI